MLIGAQNAFVPRPVFAKPAAWRAPDLGTPTVMAAVALTVATAPLTP